MAKKLPPPPKSFEDAQRELEEILRQIEGGTLGLEDSLSKWERGTQLIQYCRGVLSAAEQQIELISGSAEAGVTTTPMPVRQEAAAAADADGDEI